MNTGNRCNIASISPEAARRGSALANSYQVEDRLARQAEAMAHLAAGLSPKQVARAMGLTERTIRKYRHLANGGAPRNYRRK